MKERILYSGTLKYKNGEYYIENDYYAEFFKIPYRDGIEKYLNKSVELVIRGEQK